MPTRSKTLKLTMGEVNKITFNVLSTVNIHPHPPDRRRRKKERKTKFYDVANLHKHNKQVVSMKKSHVHWDENSEGEGERNRDFSSSEKMNFLAMYLKIDWKSGQSSPSLNNFGREIRFADDIKAPVIIQVECS